jgi:hypothetical protein
MAAKKRRKGKKSKKKTTKRGHVPIAVLRHNLKRVAMGIRRNPDATRIDKERVESL